MKLNSKLVKALNIRPEFIQLLEENTGDKLLDISLGDDFFFFTTKTKLNKWDYYIKLKCFCTEKEAKMESTK